MRCYILYSMQHGLTMYMEQLWPDSQDNICWLINQTRASWQVVNDSPQWVQVGGDADEKKDGVGRNGHGLSLPEYHVGRQGKVGEQGYVWKYYVCLYCFWMEIYIYICICIFPFQCPKKFYDIQWEGHAYHGEIIYIGWIIRLFKTIHKF